MEFSNGNWLSVPQGASDMMGGGTANLLWVVVIVLALFGGAGLLGGRSGRRPPRRWVHRVVPFRPASPRPPAPAPPPATAGFDKVEHAAGQLRAVNACRFERKRLLNRSEARLLPILDRVVREAGQGHRLMLQVALNEAIVPEPGAPFEALQAIMSKRLDFAIFDRRGLILCALEYQGEGHWGDHAAFRDAVKREALRKAGVPLLEVHPDFVEATLVRQVRDAIGGGVAGAA